MPPGSATHRIKTDVVYKLQLQLATILRSTKPKDVIDRIGLPLKVHVIIRMTGIRGRDPMRASFTSRA